MDSKGDLLKKYGIRSYPSALFIAKRWNSIEDPYRLYEQGGHPPDSKRNEVRRT